MTFEDAVYSTAFTQALGALCGLQHVHTGGYHDPTTDDILHAKAWAEHAVKAWHTAHETPVFERF
jgi:hypothetical protein